MTYIALIGAIFALVLVIIYFISKQPSKTDELSWRKCILFGLQIYMLSLFLGSLATAVVMNASREDEVMQFLFTTFLQTFVLFLYAIVFTLLVVLPTLVLGLKSLSKSRLAVPQKELRFVGIAFGLVFIINFIMTDFFANPDFMFFLAGYSIFGVIIPWALVRRKRVFE